MKSVVQSSSCDLPDVVIYELHSDSCVFRCIRDVDRDWLSSGCLADNQFNIAHLEFFLQRGNRTKTLTGRLQASTLIILKLYSTAQTLYMPLIIKKPARNKECVCIYKWWEACCYRMSEKTRYSTYHVDVISASRVSWYSVILNGVTWQNVNICNTHADNITECGVKRGDPEGK